jgi:hypothetical protein
MHKRFGKITDDQSISRVVGELFVLLDKASEAAGSEYKIGDRVEIERAGKTHTGTVRKVNTSVLVDLDAGRYATVDPATIALLGGRIGHVVDTEAVDA